jgi:hypothetical protein
MFNDLQIFYSKFFTFYNKIIYGEDFWSYDDELENVKNESIEQFREIPKYENKYLDEIRKINKQWVFTEEEEEEILKLSEQFFDEHNQKVKVQMKETINEIAILEKETIEEDFISLDYINDYEYNEENKITRKNLLNDVNEKREKIKNLQEKYNELKLQIENVETIEKNKKNSEEMAKQVIINKRLELLDNSYIIEKTPIGNVLMIYDRNKETFKYYSDCNIPYRYLEVVGRKYVKFFNCRPIYVDMEEELRLFEEKLEKDRIEKEKLDKEKLDKEKLDKEEVKEIKNIEFDKKKNVFTKFKSYNKEAGGKISMAPPPKNSISNVKINGNKENEKMILKEKANRYTYEGKFANFNFLKKIDKKVFNKKLGLSFADFKKLSK